MMESCGRTAVTESHLWRPETRRVRYVATCRACAGESRRAMVVRTGSVVPSLTYENQIEAAVRDGRATPAADGRARRVVEPEERQRRNNVHAEHDRQL